MGKSHEAMLRGKLSEAGLAKLKALGNEAVEAFVAEAVALCQPSEVMVCTDAASDIKRVRAYAVETGEELALVTPGHTAHFDGYVNENNHDQGRDKEVTKYLVPEGMNLGRKLSQRDREGGLEEIRELLSGSMSGRRMFVLFFCLGPTGSAFSIPCVQITDSSYVAHSEDLLYRGGYEELKRRGGKGEFFRFLHSAGKLVNHVSVEAEKRRIYIDLAADTVYSVNTQYAGNTVGLKKLALRLAIRKADRERWLAEHMFVMGVHGPAGRVTYFTGAFPSACGKTSTAMIPGETIVGDDLAYLRVVDDAVRAVNVEAGIFGIIQDVNPKDDPVIHKVLTSPGEVIFSNVLVKEGKPYWVGMGEALPTEGVNYSGAWREGKQDEFGNEVQASHKNARYTVRLSSLENLDERADDPDGVLVGGIIYGGRDRDTTVPVKESFDVTHGVITMGASLESETTAATLGAQGVRTFNLMSNLDFLAIPLGKYIRNHLEFFGRLAAPPKIFLVNYFLRGEGGKYLNSPRDKAVWVKWMELRVHGDVEAVTSPIGLLPRYEDLARLFREVLGKRYEESMYVREFSIRVKENLAKLARIEKVYREIAGTPEVLFEVLDGQRSRLLELEAEKGSWVSPLELE